MMHVIIGEGLHDRDYVAKHTLGFDELAERVKDYPPEKVARICGITVDEVVNLAREYATAKPAAIRLNYGMQRHSGGGMAARTIACLPAVVGAWRDPAGGVVLTTADFYNFDHKALERPDLIRGTPRTINQSKLGDALVGADPPVKAVYVYNNNPVAVCPDSNKVIAGFSRPDLFTVVHEIFFTDTCDYADIVLPATTQLEHTDVHKSYGHLYVVGNSPAIAPIGEAKPNIEVFRLLAKRMGFADACFDDTDEDVCRQALRSDNPRMSGIGWDAVKEQGWRRLAVPERFAPFADGGFPTPSGKCEFHSEVGGQARPRPAPALHPAARERARRAGPRGALSARVHLAAVPQLPELELRQPPFALDSEDGEPTLDIHPDDAAARGIANGDRVRVFNDRGAFTLKAAVTTRARRGLVVAPSVWWKKLSPDGRNANDVTSQATADLGGAATYYDCLVEVARA